MRAEEAGGVWGGGDAQEWCHDQAGACYGHEGEGQQEMFKESAYKVRWCGRPRTPSAFAVSKLFLMT